MDKVLIEIRDMHKIYNPGENEVRALDGVDLTIYENEFVAIIGHSGSGKSTLMNMLGCLDVPTSGTYRLHDIDVSDMEDDELSDVRNREIGSIFQGFNLIQNLTALENVELPCTEYLINYIHFRLQSLLVLPYNDKYVCKQSYLP